MRIVWVAVLAAGCGFDVATEDLDGTWTNDDDGVARELDFDAAATTYAIVIDGASAQTGTYAVADDTLVTVDGEERTMDHVLVWTVGWDAQGTPAGSVFGDPIYDFTDDELVLRSASAADGRRTWTRAP